MVEGKGAGLVTRKIGGVGMVCMGKGAEKGLDVGGGGNEEGKGKGRVGWQRGGGGGNWWQ